MVKHAAMGMKKFLLDKVKKKYMHRKGKKTFQWFLAFCRPNYNWMNSIVLGRHGIDSLPVKNRQKNCAMTMNPVKNKSLISTCIWKNNAVSDSFLCKSKLRPESGLSMYYIHVYTRIWLLLCALLSHIEINDVVSWTVTACFRYGDVTHILVAFNIDVNLCMVLVNINLCFCQKVEA